MKPKVIYHKIRETSHRNQKRAKHSLTLLLSQIALTLIALLVGVGASACNNVIERRDVRPLVMRDVPAQRLAFRLEPDVGLPSEIKTEDLNDKVVEIQADFNTNRKDDALLRTVKSPDGQRALALYGTADEPLASGSG